MKIGFFTDTYSQINGVTVTIKALEKSLRDLGHEIFIYAPRGEMGEERDNPYLFTSEGFRFALSPEYRWAPFPVFTIPQSNLGLDIIHVHSPVSMGLAGLINAKRLRIPCVGTVHTLLPEFWKPFLNNYLKYVTPPFLNRVIKGLLKRVDRFSLVDTSIDLGSFFMEELSWRYYAEFFKRCDVTFVPSKYAQDECGKHGFKTEILPNGIDFSKYVKEKDLNKFNTKWNLHSKDMVALYVGRLSEEKNIDLILNSAAEILETTDHLKYMIVGDGPHRSKLEKIVSKSLISDKIIFTGYLEQKNLNQAYSRATFFINASPLETQGLSVIEAMYFGNPILTVDSGAASELIEDSDVGFLFKNSKDELTRSINLLLENRTLLKSFRKKAMQKAQKYDIKQFSLKLIAKYEDLLKTKER